MEADLKEVKDRMMMYWEALANTPALCWRQELADHYDEICAIDASATGIDRSPKSFWRTG